MRPTNLLVAASILLTTVVLAPEASAHICDLPERYCGNYCPPFSGPHNHSCAYFWVCYKRICVVIEEHPPTHTQVRTDTVSDLAALP